VLLFLEILKINKIIEFDYSKKMHKNIIEVNTD